LVRHTIGIPLRKRTRQDPVTRMNGQRDPTFFVNCNSEPEVVRKAPVVRQRFHSILLCLTGVELPTLLTS